MKLKFPLTPKIIREGMQEIISEIQKETGWDLQRNLVDITISFGDAPEYFESFGVVRSESEIIFGCWMNEVEPNYNKRNVWYFIIIREAFSLFLNSDILFKEISQLTNFFLNFAAASYLQNKSKSQSIEPQIAFAKLRFLDPSKLTNNEEKKLLTKIDSLLTLILTQGISYSLILNTFLFFIEDYPLEEIGFDEIVSDFTRYLAIDPLAIAAPIYLNETTTKIITELVKSGYSTSFTEISKKLNIDISIVSREVSKLASRYKSKWFVERNWERIGLHTYLLLIEINKENPETLDMIVSDLSKKNYIRKIYKGENNKSIFIYSLIDCPHIFIENLSLSYEKYLKTNKITSIETKLIRKKIYKTAIVNEEFIPNVENFNKLLQDKKSIYLLELWNSDNFSEITPLIFLEKEENLLRTISILMYDSIVGQGVFGVNVKELNKFLSENNIDVSNITEAVNFFKNNLNRVIEKNLVDFRASLSLSNLLPANYLVFKINVHSKEIINRIIETLSIFGWLLVLITSDSLILLVLGLDQQNQFVNMIEKTLFSFNLEFEKFSLQNIFEKYIPLNELYDYKTKKWILN